MKNLKNILMIFSLLASVFLVGCQKFDELERKQQPENVLRGSEDDVTDIDEDDDDAGITDVDEDEDEETTNKGGVGDKGNGGINDDDEDEDEAAASARFSG